MKELWKIIITVAFIAIVTTVSRAEIKSGFIVTFEIAGIEDKEIYWLATPSDSTESGIQFTPIIDMYYKLKMEMPEMGIYMPPQLSDGFDDYINMLSINKRHRMFVQSFYESWSYGKLGWFMGKVYICPVSGTFYTIESKDIDWVNLFPHSGLFETIESENIVWAKAANLSYCDELLNSSIANKLINADFSLLDCCKSTPYSRLSNNSAFHPRLPTPQLTRSAKVDHKLKDYFVISINTTDMNDSQTMQYVVDADSVVGASYIIWPIISDEQTYQVDDDALEQLKISYDELLDDCSSLLNLSSLEQRTIQTSLKVWSKSPASFNRTEISILPVKGRFIDLRIVDDNDSLIYVKIPSKKLIYAPSLWESAAFKTLTFSNFQNLSH